MTTRQDVRDQQRADGLAGLLDDYRRGHLSRDSAIGFGASVDQLDEIDDERGAS